MNQNHKIYLMGTCHRVVMLSSAAVSDFEGFPGVEATQARFEFPYSLSVQCFEGTSIWLGRF